MPSILDEALAALDAAALLLDEVRERAAAASAPPALAAAGPEAVSAPRRRQAWPARSLPSPARHCRIWSSAPCGRLEE
jgi:hypothetical protein